MILSNDYKYPTQRAYVVKLRSDATPDALTGRLENLVTGGRRDFASAPELLRLLVGDIEDRQTQQVI